MREYIPFAAMEQLLLTAIGLPGSSIISIAAATGIKANTLQNHASCADFVQKTGFFKMHYGLVIEKMGILCLKQTKRNRPSLST